MAKLDNFCPVLSSISYLESYRAPVRKLVTDELPDGVTTHPEHGAGRYTTDLSCYRDADGEMVMTESPSFIKLSDRKVTEFRESLQRDYDALYNEQVSRYDAEKAKVRAWLADLNFNALSRHNQRILSGTVDRARSILGLEESELEVEYTHEDLEPEEPHGYNIMGGAFAALGL